MINGVFGVNIAVKDLAAATEKFEGLLGMKPARKMGQADFAFPGLSGVVFELGGLAIQLIASESDDTSVAKFVKTKGEGVFLVSLRSDDVEEDMKRMSESGAKFILDQPQVGKFGSVNFIHPKSAHGVQIEVYNPEK